MLICIFFVEMKFKQLKKFQFLLCCTSLIYNSKMFPSPSKTTLSLLLIIADFFSLTNSNIFLSSWLLPLLDRSCTWSLENTVSENVGATINVTCPCREDGRLEGSLESNNRGRPVLPVHLVSCSVQQERAECKVNVRYIS